MSLAALDSPAIADSWLPPTTETVKSPNARYIAVIEPGDRDGPRAPRVMVRSADAPAGTAALWEAELSNRVAPLEALVSDDGRHVVTFDNWGRIGYGEDTVAIYERAEAGGRQVARFAPDQILTPDELAAVPRSTSSRHWRQDSHTFFDSAGKSTVLCLWLGKPARWVAWDLSTGRPIDPAASPETLAGWKQKAADWAARELSRDDGERSGPMRYLSVTKDPRTPALLDKPLRADDFFSVREMRSVTAGPRWLAWSRTRESADRALATFHGDAKPVTPDPMALRFPFLNLAEPDWQYVRLGTVDATVAVAEAPGTAPADLFVYLIPEDVGPGAWHAARPVHAMRASKDSVGAPVKHVDVRFEGVTPGRYWLKAVYDAAAPFQEPSWGTTTPVCRPEVGDRHSSERRVIEVKAGAIASYGTISCSLVSN